MRECVLIVDDDLGVCRAVEEALSDNYDVLSCHNGGDALTLIADHRPDAVLLDLRLPDMPGEHVASRIREQYPDLPLVVLSVVRDTSSIVRLMHGGSVDYITKPFDAAQLREVVRRVIAGARPVKAPPVLESLLGIGGDMAKLRQQIAEAARDGRHRLLWSEPGFDLADVARAVRAEAGENVALLLLSPEDDPLLPASLPSAARCVAHLPLTERNHETAVEILAAARERARTRQGNLQLLFDASPLPHARAEAIAGTLPEVETLVCPPLRDRPEDLWQVLLYFMEKHAQRSGRPADAIALDTLEMLLSYRWPGNILEMDAVAAELVRRCDGPMIDNTAVSLMHAGAFADWADRRMRFAGATLDQCVRRAERLLAASGANCGRRRAASA